MKWKNQLLAGSFAAALLFTACNKDENAEEQNVNAQDTNFVTQLSQSNQAEIQLSQLAETRSTDSSVLNYARMMISDHTTSQQDLKDLADDIDLNVNLNDSLSAENMAIRNALSQLAGTTFDQAYMMAQVAGHQKTLTNFDAQISGGANAKVKQFATDKRPMIQMHLTMADSLEAVVGQ